MDIPGRHPLHGWMKSSKTDDAPSNSQGKHKQKGKPGEISSSILRRQYGQ